jgi:hypothetical protein
MRMPATAPQSTMDPGLQPLQKTRPSIPMPTETRKVAVRISMSSSKPGTQRMEWRLKAIEGPDAGNVFPLKGTLALGRATAGADTANQVLLTDDMVSPEHALLRWSEPDGKYQLAPAVSSIGIQRIIDGLIWLTTVPITNRVLLEPGDLLTLGHTRLEVMHVSVDDDGPLDSFLT